MANEKAREPAPRKRSGAGATKETSAAATRPNGPAKETAARKPAAAKSATAKKAPAAKKAAGRAARAGRGGELQGALREFVEAHPHGWGHDQWVDLVNRLGQQGHDVQDRDSIGMMLENERMRLHLERVEGLGPKRREALVNHYGTMWNLRSAGADEIQSVSGAARPLAERVAELAR